MSENIPLPPHDHVGPQPSLADAAPCLFPPHSPFNPKPKIKNSESPPLPAWDDDEELDDDGPARDVAPELVRLSDWGERPIDWLWPGMIPLRKVSLLVGDPEQGKTYFALDLAARVSRGDAIPPDAPTHEPAGVLILSADDELDDTLIPRLDEAGANLNYVYALTTDGPRCFLQARPQISLANGVEPLDSALRSIGNCRLIVIDPITAFIDGMSVNSHIAVRRLFTRLTSIARRYAAAVLLISHNRKDGGENACHRVIGSLAFTAAARVVFALVEDPAIAERRLLLPAKMNLQREAIGRAFRIHENRLVWEIEPVHFRPDELRRLASSGLATTDRVQRVAQQLQELLADGPRPSSEIHELARQNQVPRMVLFAAKAQAGIRALRDGHARQWLWQLPDLKEPDP